MRGPGFEPGTPARTDLESVAFDRAWLPSLDVLVRGGEVINILSRETFEFRSKLDILTDGKVSGCENAMVSDETSLPIPRLNVATGVKPCSNG